MVEKLHFSLGLVWVGHPHTERMEPTVTSFSLSDGPLCLLYQEFMSFKKLCGFMINFTTCWFFISLFDSFVCFLWAITFLKAF